MFLNTNSFKLQQIKSLFCENILFIILKSFGLVFSGPPCTILLLMFTYRIDIAYTYVVSYWPSRDVKVIIFPNQTFLIHRYFPVLIKYFSTVKIFIKFLSLSCEPSGQGFIIFILVRRVPVSFLLRLTKVLGGRV